MIIAGSNRTINVIYSCEICVWSYPHNNRLYTLLNKSIWKMLIIKRIFIYYMIGTCGNTTWGMCIKNHASVEY